MSTTLALIAVLAGGTSLGDPNAKQLIEKMLGHYYSAKSVVGTIMLTVASGNQSAKMETVLQYERPGKFYLFQQKDESHRSKDEQWRWMVTGDGKEFSYDAPDVSTSLGTGNAGTRLKETQTNPRTGKPMDIGDIYLAAGKSLGDRSMPLDIAIARRDDMLFRKNQWMDYAVTGKNTLRGVEGFRISGGLRENLGAAQMGSYQMVVSEEGDLLQYVEQMKVAVGEGKSVLVTSQWDVNLKVNATVEPSLFKVKLKYN